MIKATLASTITISTGGAYDLGSTSDGMASAFNAPYYRMEGSPTLTSNFSVNYSTITPTDKFTIVIIHNGGAPTLNGNHIYILGALVPDELAYKEYIAIGIWNGATWDVSIHPDLSTAGVITNDMIASSAVVADSIAPGAVTAEKLDAESVTAEKIVPGAISETALASSAVTASKIGAGAVTADKIGASAVTADKIGAGAVTADKIGAGAVTVDKIGAGAITATKIAAGAVSADKLAAGVLTADKLSTSSVTADKLSTSSVTADKLSTSSVTADKLATSAVTVNKVSTDLKKDAISLTLDVVEYTGAGIKLRVPYKSTLTHIHTCGIISMDNTATNYERLWFKDNAGNNIIGASLSSGKLTFPDSFSVSQVLETTVSGNNTFIAGEVIIVTPEASVATTGKVLLTLEFTRSE